MFKNRASYSLPLHTIRSMLISLSLPIIIIIMIEVPGAVGIVKLVNQNAKSDDRNAP